MSATNTGVRVLSKDLPTITSICRMCDSESSAVSNANRRNCGMLTTMAGESSRGGSQRQRSMVSSICCTRSRKGRVKA